MPVWGDSDDQALRIRPSGLIILASVLLESLRISKYLVRQADPLG